MPIHWDEVVFSYNDEKIKKKVSFVSTLCDLK